MSINNRSRANVLKQPHRQLTLAVFLMMGVAMIFALFIVISLSKEQQALTQIVDVADAQSLRLSLDHSFRALKIVTVLFAIGEVLAGILIGLVLVNRIFGPLVPMRNLIKRFIAGEYSARGTLRKHDEFIDVMEHLNELGAKLEERHGAKVTDASPS